MVIEGENYDKNLLKFYYPGSLFILSILQTLTTNWYNMAKIVYPTKNDAKENETNERNFVNNLYFSTAHRKGSFISSCLLHKLQILNRKQLEKLYFSFSREINNYLLIFNLI